jgi:hypothetical protein
MFDASSILSWLLHMFDKDWGDQHFLGLVKAVDDILQPQRTVCAARLGSSTDQPGVPFTPETLRERVAAFVAAYPELAARRFAKADPIRTTVNRTDDRDWLKAVEVEPRLIELEDDAVSVAYGLQSGDTYNPDRLYADAKRYLSALVGPRRGSLPESRYEQPMPYEERFAAIVQEVSDTRPEQEQWLRQASVFDRCSTRLYDKLSGLRS